MAALVTTSFLAISTKAQAATDVRDGSRYDRAAASCWAIKQANPAAASGVYWLQTPKLVTPQQFYCDQTTDGGGWVLVGRGRDGWSFATNGQGSASTVRTTPEGTGAFAPAALNKETIDGLLNSTSVDALPDGIRVRRAANTAGTNWQELRLHTRDNGDWSWAFGGGIKLRSVQLDGATYTNSGMHTRDWRAGGTDNAYGRLLPYSMRPHNWRSGFGYGWNVTGVNNSTSYLWQYADEGAALPFAQVWLRPKFTDFDYPALPMTGAPAQPRPALMNNRTAPTPWGVTGVVSGINSEFHLEVQALAAVGNTMYVGGEFAAVQQGATGTKVNQRYLAAFDTVTGAWKSEFRPNLDGGVWDIKQLPNGKLVIGGQFSNVGGAPNTRGVAAIDPVTGAADPTWKAGVSFESVSYTKGRTFDVQGDWLYIGGNFTKVTGGVGTTRTATVRNLARVRLADGLPDTAWAPMFNNEVYEIDASDRGDRVYAVGFFTTNSTASYIQATGFAAVTTTSPSVLVAGFKPYIMTTPQWGRQYQQTVHEAGDKFWIGGSQHNLQRYNRDTFTLEKGFITRSGGDFQSVEQVGEVLYAASHADQYVYSGATQWSAFPPISYTSVHPTLWIGAYDMTSGKVIPQFAIDGLRSRAGNGPWDMALDAQGCLWFGGDMSRGSSAQWLGGFGKVCPRDVTPPAAPSGLRATRTSTGVNLSWVASPSGGTYEVIRDGRVIVMPSGTSYTDTGAPVGATYWVRAVDSSQNRSATTAGAAA